MATLRQPTTHITKGIMKAVRPLVHCPGQHQTPIIVGPVSPPYTVDLELNVGDHPFRLDAEINLFLWTLAPGMVPPNLLVKVQCPIGFTDLQKMVSWVKFGVRHELEHIHQAYADGFEQDVCLDPSKDPSVPNFLSYFLSKHESGAYIAAFRTRARATRRPLADVMDDWWAERITPRMKQWGLADQEAMMKTIVFASYTNQYKRRYGSTRELP